MRVRGLVGFAALLASAAPLAAHEGGASGTHGSDLAAAVRPAAAAVDAFHSALRRGDTKAAADLLAEDALIFESGGAERTKAEYSAHHLPADAEFARSVSAAISRRFGGSGGQSAWVATEGRTTGTYKGKPVDLLTTETMVLRSDGGSWKIVHIHWSSARGTR
jgi:ketosteroid isomerase-like protein